MFLVCLCQCDYAQCTFIVHELILIVLMILILYYYCNIIIYTLSVCWLFCMLFRGSVCG